MTDLEKEKQRLKVEEVTRRINESKNLIVSVLDLNKLSLTLQDLNLLVPIIEEKLPNLRVLDLTGNNLEGIPDSLANFKNLKSLYLDKYNLNNLPESLNKLRSDGSLNITLLNETKKLFDILLDDTVSMKEIQEHPSPDESKTQILKKGSSITDKPKPFSYEDLCIFSTPSNLSKSSGRSASLPESLLRQDKNVTGTDKKGKLKYIKLPVVHFK